MSTNSPTIEGQCRVLRCLNGAAWQVTVTDHGKHVLTARYCAAHAAQHSTNIPKPGRRVILDALGVEGVGR